MNDVDAAFEGKPVAPSLGADAAFAEGYTGKPSAAPAAPRTNEELKPLLESVAKRYPALSRHLEQTQAQWGDPKQYEKTGGHLEFFPPWESYNPNPGKITLEVYNHGLKGKQLEDALAGDMLHHLSAVSPDGQPVDPRWREMRDQIIAARNPSQRAIDERAYANAVRAGDDRTFDEWMDVSRADAYVRGYITPDADNQWADAYTPQQREILEQMRSYLAGGSEASP